MSAALRYLVYGTSCMDFDHKSHAMDHNSQAMDYNRHATDHNSQAMD
jgi:hypothetical protein